MNSNQQSRPNSTKCANCGLAYSLTGTKPPCPEGEKGPAGWSADMLAFMRCTAADAAKKGKAK